MEPSERILIAVDDSEPSEKAVAYVGRMLGSGPGFFVRLLHVLPSIPSQFLEESVLDIDEESDPAHARRVKKEVEAPRSRWVSEAEKQAQPLFERMRRILTDAGFDGAHIETICHAPIPEESTSLAILETAREDGFATIVVGRKSLPWYREMVHQHISDELEHQGLGLTIWVVE